MCKNPPAQRTTLVSVCSHGFWILLSIPATFSLFVGYISKGMSRSLKRVSSKLLTKDIFTSKSTVETDITQPLITDWKKIIYTHLFHSNVPYKIQLPTIISLNTWISRVKFKMANCLCTVKTNSSEGPVAIGQGEYFVSDRGLGLDDTGKRFPA